MEADRSRKSRRDLYEDRVRGTVVVLAILRTSLKFPTFNPTAITGIPDPSPPERNHPTATHLHHNIWVGCWDLFLPHLKSCQPYACQDCLLRATLPIEHSPTRPRA